jgi:hypothetical protein
MYRPNRAATGASRRAVVESQRPRQEQQQPAHGGRDVDQQRPDHTEADGEQAQEPQQLGGRIDRLGDGESAEPTVTLTDAPAGDIGAEHQQVERAHADQEAAVRRAETAGDQRRGDPRRQEQRGEQRDAEGQRGRGRPTVRVPLSDRLRRRGAERRLRHLLDPDHH